MLTLALAVEFEFVVLTILEGCICGEFRTLVKFLLFTKYLTSTSMPTSQQKKEHKNVLGGLTIDQKRRKGC